MTIWLEKLRNGDMAINEVKADAIISCLIYNKDLKECAIFSNYSAKRNPTREDIEFYFENSEIPLKALTDAGISIGEKPCSILSPA